jgi:hypothetical protein
MDHGTKGKPKTYVYHGDTEYTEVKLFFRLPGDNGKRKPSALSGKRDIIFKATVCLYS